jgi:hypothetical protein
MKADRVTGATPGKKTLAIAKGVVCSPSNTLQSSYRTTTALTDIEALEETDTCVGPHIMQLPLPRRVIKKLLVVMLKNVRIASRFNAGQ